MSYELVGKVVEKYDTQQVSDKFKKREFVVEKSENNFTETIKFQVVQDKVSILDPVNVGDEVKVLFDIRGNKWNDKYFVNLQAWKVEGSSASAPQSGDVPPPPPDDYIAPTADNSDLPF